MRGTGSPHRGLRMQKYYFSPIWQNAASEALLAHRLADDLEDALRDVFPGDVVIALSVRRYQHQPWHSFYSENTGQAFGVIQQARDLVSLPEGGNRSRAPGQGVYHHEGDGMLREEIQINITLLG